MFQLCVCVCWNCRVPLLPALGMNILVHLVRCVCLWPHRDASWPVCHTSWSFQHQSFLRSTPVHPFYSLQNGLAQAKGRKSDWACVAHKVTHSLTCGHKRTTFITESRNSVVTRRYKSVISERRCSWIENKRNLAAHCSYFSALPIFCRLFHFNVLNLEFNVSHTIIITGASKIVFAFIWYVMSRPQQVICIWSLNASV